MKNYLILLLLWVSFAKSTSGQILTPDFRFYSSCPTSFSQVSKCTGWVQPTGGTSDYFNACASDTFVGVPKNSFGYQPAANNAYAGLYCHYRPGHDYREYIGTNFAPLTIGQTYTMTIMVSLSDNSTFAVDGLGVFFTTYSAYYPTLVTRLPVTPQVDYSSFGIISDKVNWVKMSKSFVADSAYTHLIFGCFKPDSILQIDTLSSDGIKGVSYYYVAQIGEPDSMRHSPTDSVTPPSTDAINIITLTDVPPTFAFPNAFSPNNDALNDVFRIISNQRAALHDFNLHIFNRWGQRIFFSNDPTIGWDGTFNNIPQDMGTYFYFAEFTINGKRERIKGNVTLIR